MSFRAWFPLLVWSLLACTSCDLGTKFACDVDGDCFSGLSCIEGACYKCAADKAGCGCVDGGCLGGMVCDPTNACVDCSDINPCATGLACDSGRCVPCNSNFAGCSCDAGECGTGLVCNEANRCERLACADGVRNGDEVDVDCGGSCPPCGEGARCLAAADCESFSCDQEACLPIGECRVPTGQFPSIQSAVDETRCTTIQLGEGLFDEHVRIDREVALVGVPVDQVAEDGTVLSNGVPAPTIEIAEGIGTVLLRHLRFRGGSALQGAGVRSERDVVVEDCVFEDNRATVDAVSETEGPHPCGGAIFVEDGSLTVRSSTFFDNRAEETRFAGPGIDVEASGGAICVLGAGDLLVESSDFRRNVAVATSDIPASAQSSSTDLAITSAAGGAIFGTREGSAIIRDSTFANNAARTSAVARQGERRFADVSGGAISLSASTTIEHSSFIDNLAHTESTGVGIEATLAQGGALATLELEWMRDTVFEHNWAFAKNPARSDAKGGAAYLGAVWEGRLESNRFFRNRVDALDAEGAALFLTTVVVVVNSVFWDNYGAGASAMWGGAFVFNSTFVNNGPGPVLEAHPFVRFVLQHSVFTGEPGSCNGDGIVSDGYNVFDEDHCLAAIASETDQVVEEALVEREYNRPGREGFGTARTRFSAPGYPLEDSPVVDAGDPDGCRDDVGNIISADNRGADRAGSCDVGAFEFDAEEAPRSPVYPFLLRRAVLRAPQFFAPGDDGCAADVTQALASFIEESIAPSDGRPADRDCDGLIDAPMLLVLRTSDDPLQPGHLTGGTQCVATHTACEYASGLSGGSYRVSMEEPCSLEDGSAVVAPGAHGCFEFSFGRTSSSTAGLEFDVGVRFPFSHLQLVGGLDVRPDRIVNGVLKGFVLSAHQANGSLIPDSLQPAVGGARRLSELCITDLEEHDGRLGYFVEFDVELEAVTMYGQGLPPLRPLDCE